MGRSTEKETGLSEQRKYRSWTARQKLEIVLAGLKGDRSVRDVCREHGISETLYYGWRDKLFEAGREALAGKEERQGERELKKRVRDLERALGGVRARRAHRSRARDAALLLAWKATLLAMVAALGGDRLANDAYYRRALDYA